MENIPRISASPEGTALINRLRNEHGELMFHQSGGCCDGSQPMCFEKGEFKVGENDIYLGDIEGCGFFMSRDQFECWQHTHLTLNVTVGRGSSFSLEIPLGLRFIIRSRLFNDDEIGHLILVTTGEEYLEKNTIKTKKLLKNKSFPGCPESLVLHDCFRLISILFCR